MEIVEKFMTNNPCYRAGRKIAVQGLMLHSVGCPQPSAEAFIKRWNNPNEKRACVHAFIDGNTGKIFQTLPWDHRGWHGGGISNNTYIGVEMCEPSTIKYTGGATFRYSDRQACMEVVKRTYDAAVELFAFLCFKFHLDPMKDGVIVSHNEGHARGIATGHSDPEHLWNGLQSGYTMDGFRRDVAMCLAKAENKPPVDKTIPKLNEEVIKQLMPEAKAASAIRPGILVSISKDAVYYNGKEMPPWVKNERWFVKSVNGDRAVIDMNESRTRSICSPINTRYLQTLSDTGTSSIQNPAQPMYKSSVINNDARKQITDARSENYIRKQVSEKGVALVAKFEGCQLQAYRCPAGVWTIGYGHTEGVQSGQRLSSIEEAKRLLKSDLQKYADYVNEYAQNGTIQFALNQNQFDALTSFCYNCGKGNLKALVSGRDATTVADKMLLYNKGGGMTLAGLTRRRAEERKLFLS